MDFRAERSEDDRGRLVIRVHGSVDSYTSRQLDEVLREPSTDAYAAVLVNLDGVAYLDSSGLEILLAALKRTRARGASFTIACDAGAVRTLFEVTGLTTAFGMPGTARP
ncbi:MAG: hypothetical protein PVSMB8_12570 [Vulcanimicrobiaceae bacterium]